MAYRFLNTAVCAVCAAALVSCGRTIPTVRESTSSGISAATQQTMLMPTDNTTEASAAHEEPSTEQFSLDISYTSGEMPESYIIEGFETVMQEPELPTGCEVVSLAQTLNFCGFSIDKVELADEFMPIDFSGSVTMEEAYVGDPKANNGFGCYAPVIVLTADDYFQSIDSPCYAADLTGTGFRDLFCQIAEGRPVIVWTTIGLRETYPNYKFTTGSGEEFWFNDYQHCMTLYGYDIESDIVYAADPLVGNCEYSMSLFEKIYEIMGRQAVIICGDSDTPGHYAPIEDKPESPMKSRNHKKEEENAAQE